MLTRRFVKSITLCWQLYRCADRKFTIQNVNFYKYSLCLCRTIGLLKRVVNILHLLRNKCTEYRQNSSRLWKMINKFTNKLNDKTDIIDYLKVENQDYYEHKLIAEEFAKHFSGVGKQYAEQIPSPIKNINHYL